MISHNRITHNGGSNLGGAVAIFTGANGYDFSRNDVCGNFSSEYGGGISHFGNSQGGSIHDNQIYLNGSYDEGGGVMIAGELPTNPATTLSRGSGDVSIFNNLIQENVANDDGGGLRLLMTSGANANGSLNNSKIDVFNNIIVNNVSTHEGGGVALDDATNTRFYHNTVMKNLTTATAQTSNGQPAPAGLSRHQDSILLRTSSPPATPHTAIPSCSTTSSGTTGGAWNLASGTVSGIGLTRDPNPVNHWDMGVADGTGLLHPHYTSLQVLAPDNYPSGTVPPTTVQPVGNNPNVIQAYDTKIAPFPWRGDPHFINTITIAQDVPELLAGTTTSDRLRLAAGEQRAEQLFRCGLRPRRPVQRPRVRHRQPDPTPTICPRTGS